FSEPVEGLDPADFSLSDGATTTSLEGASLSTVDNIHWTLGGLTSLTQASGTYTLSHADPSKISDLADAPLAGLAPFRFFVYNGGPAGEFVRLAATPEGAIGVYVNSSPTPSFTLTAGSVDQIVVIGSGGDDALVDEMPTSLRPPRGVTYCGGAGTD